MFLIGIFDMQPGKNPHTCIEYVDEQFGGAVDPASKRLADRYNQGKLPMSLLDRYAIEELVKVLQFGANKYARHNWRKGLSQSDILDSTLRHVFAALDGEDLDPESGLPHMAHAMCNCMFYLANGKYHPELDDRFIPYR